MKYFINFLFRKIFLNVNDHERTSSSKLTNESIILTLKSIHHDLMRCVRKINYIFGIQTMLCIGTTFIFTLFTLFSAFKYFFYHDVDFSVALSSLFWSFFYNYFIFCIIQTCNIVDIECEKLANMIYKLINRNVCSSMLMQTFGNQVKQISGKSTCGLFNFDYQLIMMVSGISSKKKFITDVCFHFRQFQLFRHIF